WPRLDFRHALAVLRTGRGRLDRWGSRVERHSAALWPEGRLTQVPWQAEPNDGVPPVYRGILSGTGPLVQGRAVQGPPREACNAPYRGGIGFLGRRGVWPRFPR